jgi:D-arabinose 1-dehydrogenase-like Zn-dependent alcohol dehydrogenase
MAGVIAKLGSNYKGDLKVGNQVGVLNFKHACGSARRDFPQPSYPLIDH